ncbi:hypothetical protein KBC03_00860 [Patescibacteria group bacterium]|nr:hypothetical protein [Patescibacteria group bacterium]
MWKKIVLTLSLGAILGLNVAFAVPPTFDGQIVNPLLKDDTGSGETLISPGTFGISANSSLKDNVYNMFSPLNDNAIIRRALRVVMTGILVLYLAQIGIDMMQKSGDEAAQKKVRRSFLYILFGGFLVWGVTRILGTALKIGTVQGTQGLLSNLQNNLLFQVLSFMK